MSGSGAYDAFISYSRRDREAVHFVARILERHGLSVFVDEWYLAPGQGWLERLEREIRASKSVAVFVGPGAMASWQKREVELALDRQTHDDVFIVVPVLLLGSDPPLGFLRLNSWVDLRDGHDDPRTIEVLARALRGEPPGGGLILTPKDVSPYRGLRPFRTEDASFFFGREAFTTRLVERVHASSLVAVAGASGAGKSSLVLAGLVPILQRNNAEPRWEVVVMRPTDRPFYQLAEALLPVWQPSRSELNPAVGKTERLKEVGQLADALAGGTISLRDVINDGLRGQPGTARLLLVVDQWEELYTLCRDESERARFIELILDATAHAPVTAVLTLRGDFYRHVLEHRVLADRLQGGVVNLSPMNRDELERAVRLPAEAVRLRFESGLVDRVLDDVERAPGSLPLLEFVLEQLWHQRRDDLLTHAAYEAMGELQGAISTRAQLELERLAPADQERLRAAFLQLVRPGETTEDTRRRATRAEIGEAAWPLVQRFVDARLLVAGQDQSAAGETVEVAHEALIRNWQKLRVWLDEDREFLLWRERLRRGLGEWERTKRDDGALLRGVALSEGRRWLAARAADLTATERHFIEQSGRVDRRRRRQRRGLVAATLAVVALAGIGAGEAMLDRSRVRVTAALLSAGQASGDPLVQALLTAELRGATEPTDGVSIVRSFANRRVPRLAFRGEWGAVRGFSWSPDGARVAAAFTDGKARVWRADGSGAATVLKHDEVVTTIAFAPDSKRVVTGTEKGRVLVWSLESGKVVAELPPHDGELWQVEFSPDGRRVLTLAQDAVRLVAVDGSTEPVVFQQDGTDALSVALNRDGTRVAVGFANGSVQHWSSEGGPPVVMTGRHRDDVLSVAFDGSGRRVVSASRDSSARVWSVDGRLLETLDGHDGAVWSAEFDSSGARVATASEDGTARVWRLGGTRESDSFIELRGHSARVWSARFSPDGTHVVTASDDGTARLYAADRADQGEPLLGHHGSVIGAAFDDAATTILTASSDGTVRLWPVAADEPLVLRGTGVRLATFAADDRVVTGSAVGDVSLWTTPGGEREPVGRHDGSMVISLDASRAAPLALTLSAAGEAVLWSLDGSRRRTPLLGHTSAIRHTALSDDGTRALTIGLDSTVRVWDTATGSEVVSALRHENAISAAAFGDGGRGVATITFDGTVTVWRVDRPDRGTFLGRFPSTGSQTDYSVAYSADGRHVLVGSGETRLWEVAKPGEGTRLEGHGTDVRNVAFDPTSRRLATAAGDGTLYIQNAAGSGAVLTLNGHTGQVKQLTFSPDGERLLTASSDGTARVWRTSGAGAPIVLAGHNGDVTSARFSPDQKHVLTASDDGTARLWSIDWHPLVARLASSTQTCLSTNERIRYLGQRPAAARPAFERCERERGRAPPAATAAK